MKRIAAAYSTIPWTNAGTGPCLNTALDALPEEDRRGLVQLAGRAAWARRAPRRAARARSRSRAARPSSRSRPRSTASIAATPKRVPSTRSYASGVPPRWTWPRIVMRDSKPVRSSISARACTAMPPSRTWPNASVAPPNSVTDVAVLRRRALGDDDDRERARRSSWRWRMRSQTSSMSNGRSGTRITSAPPAIPE